jgi:hypothetical protein
MNEENFSSDFTKPKDLIESAAEASRSFEIGLGPGDLPNAIGIALQFAAPGRVSLFKFNRDCESLRVRF